MHLLLANIKIFKSRWMQFCASSHCFRDMNILHFSPSKSMSKSRSKIVSMTQFDRKWPNLQIYSLPHIFVLALIVSEIYKLKMLHFQNSTSRSRSKIFAVTLFDGKYQNLQMLFTNFCASLTISEIHIF